MKVIIKPIEKPIWLLLVFAPGMGFSLSIAVCYFLTVSGISQNVLASAGFGGMASAVAMLPEVFASRNRNKND